MNRNNKLLLQFTGLITLMLLANPANAIGTLLVAVIMHTTTFTFAMTLAAAAINIAVSIIVTKNMMKNLDTEPTAESPNPGNRMQVAPATENKLPVVYGTAWCGGIIVDAGISSNYQKMFFVLALSEVTNSEIIPSQADSISFGDVYWGGKKVVFASGGAMVRGLIDESTNAYGTLVNAMTNVTSPLGSFQVRCDNLGNGAYTQGPFPSSGTVIIDGEQIKYSSVLWTATVSGGLSVLRSLTGTFTISERGANSTNVAAHAAGRSVSSTTSFDYKVYGKLYIHLYRNGSESGVNTGQSAQAVIQDVNCTYKWDGYKKMSNCAFAIVVMEYSQYAGLTGMQQTQIQVINNLRQTPADAFKDYLLSKRYGAGLTESQLDLPSFTTLASYCNTTYNYTDKNSLPATQPRFTFNGVIDTKRTVMQNLQDMCNSCDCLLRYNEITGKWGIITQQSSYTVALALSDDNIISPLQISPMDLSSSYNIVEVKFAERNNRDAFSTATLDLSQSNPSLMYANEPANKLSISLNLVNNNVQAQYIANRLLEASRVDLQVSCSVNHKGLVLEAGDVVTITNTNYGFNAKPFRITKVTEEFSDEGVCSVKLIMQEFSAAVFDDIPVTEFIPPEKSSLLDASNFGDIPAPTLLVSYPDATIPLLNIQVQTSSNGIVQYVELYRATKSNPLDSELYFCATSEIASAGSPYPSNTVLPPITITGLTAGTWYFFARMVNNLNKSAFSYASLPVYWRPYTFTFSKRYLGVAYADDANGTNLSFNPTDKLYFGLSPQDDDTAPAGWGKANPQSFASQYTWYQSIDKTGPMGFGHTVDSTTGLATVYPLRLLVYANRGSRTFSFGTTYCTQYGEGGGAQVWSPSTSINGYDVGSFSGLPYKEIPATQSAQAAQPQLGVRVIDLDRRTGQSIINGTTTQSSNDGQLDVVSNEKGQLTVALKKFLDFPNGASTFTGSAAVITYDQYGRIVGLKNPDNFYYSRQEWVYAAGGSLTFTPNARNTTSPNAYILGQDLIFVNGILLRPDAATTYDYSETLTTFTINFSLQANDVITCISYRNTTTETPAGSYNTFTRNYYTPSNVGAVTVSNLDNGFEMLFVNGVCWTSEDYDVLESQSQFTSTCGSFSGEFCHIQWTRDKVTQQPCSKSSQAFVYAVPTGNTYAQTYPYTIDAAAFNLWQNGVLLRPTADYTTASNAWTLLTIPTTIETIFWQQSYTRTGNA